MAAIEVVSGGRHVDGESAEEVLALLIDGYPRSGDQEAKRMARVQAALLARGMVQTLLNAGESFDQVTPEEKAILLDRGNEPPAVTSWRCAVPLVLITAFYQPLGNLPQPEVSPPAQIWWIDPTTADSLLGTLHGVRWLDLSLSDGLEPRLFESEDYPNLGTDGATGYRWRSVG